MNDFMTKANLNYHYSNVFTKQSCINNSHALVSLFLNVEGRSFIHVRAHETERDRKVEKIGKNNLF